AGQLAPPGEVGAAVGHTFRRPLRHGGGGRRRPPVEVRAARGAPNPILTDEHLDLVLDYESVGAAGSMLGTRALQVFDETTSVVRCVARDRKSTRLNSSHVSTSYAVICL